MYDPIKGYYIQADVIAGIFQLCGSNYFVPKTSYYPVAFKNWEIYLYSIISHILNKYFYIILNNIHKYK